jgi:hypothetical protein
MIRIIKLIIEIFKTNYKYLSFYIWLIIWFYLNHNIKIYYFWCIILFLIIIKLINGLFVKKIIIKNSIQDIFLLRYIHFFHNKENFNIITFLSILSLNYFLGFNIIWFFLWLNFFDIFKKQYKLKNLQNKKKKLILELISYSYNIFKYNLIPNKKYKKIWNIEIIYNTTLYK